VLPYDVPAPTTAFGLGNRVSRRESHTYALGANERLKVCPGR